MSSAICIFVSSLVGKNRITWTGDFIGYHLFSFVTNFEKLHRVITVLHCIIIPFSYTWNISDKEINPWFRISQELSTSLHFVFCVYNDRTNCFCSICWSPEGKWLVWDISIYIQSTPHPRNGPARVQNGILLIGAPRSECSFQHHQHLRKSWT